MGFKRTTEGRVFFQKNDEKSGTNEGSERLNNMLNKSGNTPANKDSTQMQILGLLKALNERLKDSQADRKKMHQELETYKMMVMSLQEKADRQEKDSKDLKDQISKNSESSVKKAEEAEKLSREAFREFEEARRLIAEIEEKSERTESLIKKQQSQMLQVQEQSRIKWDDLKKSNKQEVQAMLDRLSKAEESQKKLDERIEENAITTLKLDRKLEKSVQDRSRLIRKLERIEDTVMQTNEAMNARAMVLLTDQNSAAQSGMQHKPAIGNDDQPQTPLREEDQYLDVPWWKKPMRMQATSVSLVVLAAALLGWGVSEVQKPDGFTFNMDFPSFDMAENSRVPIQAQTARLKSVEAEALNSGNEGTQTASTYSYDTNRFDDVVDNYSADMANQELSAPIEAATTNELDRIMQEQAMAVEEKDDIGAIDLNDEEQLLALLEDDPSALAAELNKIEPASIPAAEQEVIEPQAQAVIEQDEPVETAVIDQVIPQSELPSTLNGSISDRIRPDSSLPSNIKEIEAAAFSGNAEAQHDLAAIYIAGHGGVQQDYEQASLWFEEAAHNGIANARYNLGVLYHQGIGVEQNVERAFDWYKTAADLGHPEAQYNLGIAHIEGIGVSYDPQRAATYFKAASEGGVMEAAYNLGLIYENGLLGKAEPDTALMWYKRAADQGSPEAKAALEQLANKLGMQISDVNRLIKGMESLNAPAQKKTEKSVKTSSASPVDLAPSQALSTTAQVQQQLMAMGLYPGPVDGIEGALTKDAVRTYQSRNNLAVDGEINESLLSHMQYQFQDIGDNEQGSRAN